MREPIKKGCLKDATFEPFMLSFKGVKPQTLLLRNINFPIYHNAKKDLVNINSPRVCMCITIENMMYHRAFPW